VRSCQAQILCAEGHEDTREFLAVWLGLAGYEVTATETAAECVKLACGRRFDLYLIGDGLLDGRAIELVETIRSLDGRTPLILNSAKAYPKDIERGMKAGAQVYLTRPSDPDYLLLTISLLIT
jgi:DNA-binding response OmpR family regulator